MGRGRGGYTEHQIFYRDSGGHKVTDKGAIFVAERYMDQGYEVVFKQIHGSGKTCDLLIKTSDDTKPVKYIEVKRVTSLKTSKLATNIGDGFTHFNNGYKGTVAIVLPNHRSDSFGRRFAEEGFSEAIRKGWVKGNVEVWFSDGIKYDLN